MTNRLSDYDFELPPEQIAQQPAPVRHDSRLLVLDRATGSIEDRTFRVLPEILSPGDLLIANNSRVIPARLTGLLESGGRVELLLIRQSGDGWETMTRPARKLKAGTSVLLPGNMRAVVQETLADGRRIVRFEGERDFEAWLALTGKAPLPPYIREYPADPERYQTVYADKKGSVAAPTAGLHFTPELLRRLKERGVEVRFVTLHVGPGTFKPLCREDLESARLEPEWGQIPPATADAVNLAKANGRRVVCVGTTTTRLLEGVARSTPGQSGMAVGQAGCPVPPAAPVAIGAWSGQIDLFIRPPFTFRMADALITNFHLPRSSLLMLVSAFAGYDRTITAYRHAVADGYRFYSFGDAMLIR